VLVLQVLQLVSQLELQELLLELLLVSLVLQWDHLRQNQHKQHWLANHNRDNLD